MKTRSILILLALLLGLLVRPVPPVRATASLELYGTFHAMGVEMQFSPARFALIRRLCHS